ncbi:MAG: UDP-N-acetylmuramate--L-alanine ligase, partial [Gemmatimonadales bacterium]|nr:UDP-N-acetylmuramate--L-alanine ligase [Gemmatimonadales bacterium]
PELVAAREAGIPVLSRAAALAQVVADGRVIGVAGTHGKTTTTAMITGALVAAGRDPTGLVGGRVSEWEGNVRFGDERLYVVEADEYDRSFLQLPPTVAVVNNVEPDHMECYGSVGELEAAFVQFASGAERVLVGADDGGARRVGAVLTVPVWRVGTAPDADVRLSDVVREPGRTAARVQLPGGADVALELRVPGLHNLRNGAMALAAAVAVDADPDAAARGLAAFQGVGRRFELLGTVGGVTVIDDYAHHPSEVAATLGAAQQRYPGRRLVAVFQPHLFSRTRDLGQATGIVLAMADVAVVAPVYPAREVPIPGVTGEIVADAARQAGAEVHWVSDRGAVLPRLEELVAAGDVVITLGAGDITDVGRQFVRRRGAVAV